MRDLLSIRDLSRKDVEGLLNESARMERLLGRPQKLLAGKIVAHLFFEPSTRTNLSFQAATLRLGGSVLPFYPQLSSAAKGESFADTIRMVDGYADALVIRHPEEGSAQEAAAIASHPVINAGDGANQHPTQTLIDLYTMQKLKGKISNLRVALVGDLKHARTMRSLLYGLALFGVSPQLVSPASLRMDRGFLREIRKKFGIRPEERGKPDLKNCDVLYVCRVQQERFASRAEAESAQRAFRITPQMLSDAPRGMAILHPLPKLSEILPKVDSDPRAKYFSQAKNGVPVRMAVLKKCVP